jgi:anthranilate phosphoribosyltransferase
MIIEMLRGADGPRRDIVLINAAAGLLAAGLASDLREGMELAVQSIDSGAAMAKLELLKKNFPGT